MGNAKVLNEIWKEMFNQEEMPKYSRGLTEYEKVLVFIDITWEWYMEECYKEPFKVEIEEDSKRTNIYNDLKLYREKEDHNAFWETVNMRWGQKENPKRNFSIGINWNYTHNRTSITMPNEKFLALHIMLLHNQEFIDLFCNKKCEKHYVYAKNIIKYARKLEKNWKERNKLMKNNRMDYASMVDMTTEYGYIYEKLTGVNLALLFMNYYGEFKQLIKGCKREEELAVGIKKELEAIAKLVVKNSFVYTRIIMIDIKLKEVCNCVLGSADAENIGEILKTKLENLKKSIEKHGCFKMDCIVNQTKEEIHGILRNYLIYNMDFRELLKKYCKISGKIEVEKRKVLTSG